MAKEELSGAPLKGAPEEGAPAAQGFSATSSILSKVELGTTQKPRASAQGHPGPRQRPGRPGAKEAPGSAQSARIPREEVTSSLR